MLGHAIQGDGSCLILQFVETGLAFCQRLSKGRRMHAVVLERRPRPRAGEHEALMEFSWIYLSVGD